MNTTPLGREVVGDASLGGNDCPTAAELVHRYLVPLARWLDVRTRHEVLGVSRTHLRKGEHLGSAARAEDPFRLLLRGPGGETAVSADVVLDCTGTFRQPSPVGAGGLPAPGEAELARKGRVVYGPTPVDPELAGKHVVLVGDGATAATVLRDLLALDPPPRVTWLTLASAGPGFVSPPDDPLPERAALYDAARAAIERPAVDHHAGAVVDALVPLEGHRIEVRLATGDAIVADRVLGCTGFRPDISLLRELQFHVCWGSEGPMKLSAALLAQHGGGGDCLDAGGTGPEALRSPEPNLFVLGSKSYGRRSDFLIQHGHQQVADVLTWLATDS
jgi:cation diffusion facilitator CzcD-associated flavoprotein CzcO